MISGELDQTDKEILRLLQADATLPGKEIALLVNKSTAAVHERIRRLRNEGYIRKIVAVLDKKKINKNLVAYSQVLLHNHSEKTLSLFAQAVIQFPEVVECHQMSGAFDFLLKVVTADIESYHHFYIGKLAKLPDITTVQSFFVLSEAKNETAYPLS